MNDFFQKLKIAIPKETLKEILEEKGIQGFNPVVIQRLMDDVIRVCGDGLSSIESSNGYDANKAAQKEILDAELRNWKFDPTRISSPTRIENGDRTSKMSQNIYYLDSVEMKESGISYGAIGANYKEANQMTTRKKTTYNEKGEDIKNEYAFAGRSIVLEGNETAGYLPFYGEGYETDLSGQEILTTREDDNKYIQVIKDSNGGEKTVTGALKQGEKLPDMEDPYTQETNDNER